MRTIKALGIAYLLTTLHGAVSSFILSQGRAGKTATPSKDYPAFTLALEDYFYSDEVPFDPPLILFYSKYKNNTYYIDPNGKYFNSTEGVMKIYKNTYSLGFNETFYKDPYGIYKQNGFLGFILDPSLTTTTTRRTITTTTQFHYETQAPPHPNTFQNMYMKYLIDTLPPIEILRCGFCPRAYIPVCGSDGRSYTNVCKMRCLNSMKSKGARATIRFMGICPEYQEPYEY